MRVFWGELDGKYDSLQTHGFHKKNLKFGGSEGVHGEDFGTSLEELGCKITLVGAKWGKSSANLKP